jgi:ribosomal RNA assembly protein
MPVEEFAIPKERVAIAIGEKGNVKKTIEKETKTKVTIDSKNGDVEVSGEDAVKVLNAATIVRAIGRGFSPEHALKLLDDDYYFELVHLPEIVGKNWKALQSKRGRVIGKEGRIREQIEKDTQTFVSVYGKTISVIGKAEQVAKAVEAIHMLLGGAQHQTVLNYLRQSLDAAEEFEFR